MKLTKKSAPVSLEKGQLWKVENAYIQIIEQGKRLIHYKLLNSVKQRAVPVKMAEIQTVRNYLKAKRAELV